jgi:arylsulfatase A-like enzyme
LEPLNALWMEHEEATIAEVLKAAGYATCHVGKWHLGPEPWHPETQGFDRNIGGCERGSPPGYFDPYQDRLPNLPSRQEGEYLTDREADEAVGFIRQHRDRPFFLYMSHYAVHAPLQSRPELTEKYEAKPPTQQKNPVYAGMVESVDDATGKILATLDELDLANDTLVIFTSDNGGVDAAANGHPQSFYTHNGPLRMGKCWPYEGGIRVPAIVRWPGVIAPNTVEATLICGIDLLPTICTATNVTLPTDRPIDGQDLTPLLRGEGPLQRDTLYWHFPHYQHASPNSIVRSGPWKLIKWYESNTFELFNLENDLSEMNDLADRLPEKVESLDRKLQAWLADTGAKLPRRKPAYNEQKDH